jgi:hypothetical protein
MLSRLRRGRSAAITPTFVVREPGRWGTLPLDEELPVELSFDELLDLVSAGGRASAPTLAEGAAPWAPSGILPGDLVIAPLPSTILFLAPGGLVSEAWGGERLLLDPVDLHLLDALWGPRAADDLATEVQGRADASPGDLLDRMARLAAGGVAVLPVTS